MTDYALRASAETVLKILELTGDHGVERALDASGSHEGRLTAVQATGSGARWLSSLKVAACRLRPVPT